MRKTAIVTGGSKGIGKAICEKLAKEGCNVLINYKSSEIEANSLLEKLTAEGYSAELFCGDMSNYQSVKEMIDFTIKKFGSIDILINNAGISEFKLFTDISEADWQNMISNNLNSAFYCSKEVVKYMISNKYGKIVNISSIWGIVGSSCEVHYSVSKGGLISLTKALAKELAPSNINVNCIAPGMIDTDMNKELTGDEIENIIEDIPMMRMGKSEDIAELTLFLVSDKSNFITGQVISPNGGYIV